MTLKTACRIIENMENKMTITEFARKGGNAVKKKYGKKYFKELAKKSVKARSAKKPHK